MLSWSVDLCLWLFGFLGSAEGTHVELGLDHRVSLAGDEAPPRLETSRDEAALMGGGGDPHHPPSVLARHLVPACSPSLTLPLHTCKWYSFMIPV